MDLRFDHAVVVVERLAEAVATWRAAGFVVVPGGRHEEIPSENALIVFEDGGYLELLAVRDEEERASLALRRARRGWEAGLRRAPAVARRFLPRLAGPPGVGDAAWRGVRLDRFAAESRRRGFPMTGPVAMSRERPGGTRLEWSLVLPVTDRLPLLIEDVTPRQWRVAVTPENAAHPNGARGVGEVVVRVANVPMAALEYADVFGARPEAHPDGATRVTLGDVSITLVEGEPEQAMGVRLRGVSVLPAAIVAAGVRGGG